MSDVTLNPSITPSFTTPSEIQTVQSTAPEQTSPSYTPLWMVNDSIGSNAFEMLGMRLPKASGDIAAILAQISLTLELTVDESEKNKALAGYAKLASALGAYGINALRETIGRSETGLTTAAERLADYNTGSAGLVADRNSLNATISSCNTQIAGLEGQLASLQTQYANAKDADKPAIQAQINSVTASLNTANSARNEALASRKAIEISLAELKIETLGAQISDLQAQLALAPEGSEEAAALTTLISGLNGKLGDMQTDLNALKTQAYTESSGNSRYAATDSNFTSGFTNVETTLGKLVSDGLTALEVLGPMVLAILAQAAASLNAATSAGVEGQRDIAVERHFGDISDELEAATARLKNMLLNVDKTSDARLDRIEEIARGFLAAISDILGALDGLDATAAGAPPAGQTVGNRLRLGV